MSLVFNLIQGKTNAVKKVTSSDFTYAGTFSYVSSDGGGNWEIALLSGSNAEFKFKVNPGIVDIFMVGAGAPGTDGSKRYNSGNTFNYVTGGDGGLGAECKTIDTPLNAVKNTSYYVTIGTNGGDTFGFGYTAIGGSSAWAGDGEDPRLTGGRGAYSYGSGSYTGGKTEREAGNGKGDSLAHYAFNDANTEYNTGARYGASGPGGGTSVYRTYSNGGRWINDSPGTAYNGAGSGGSASSGAGGNGGDATANTGAGGGGGGAGQNSTGDGGAGGSGIIILRNHRGA